MKFPKIGKKDWMMVGIIVVALVFFAWANIRQRENFVDNGWKPEGDQKMLDVSITEDGTLWGIGMDKGIQRKPKGGSWIRTAGNSASNQQSSGKFIAGIDSNTAYAVANNLVWKTTNGGQTWDNQGGLGEGVNPIAIAATPVDDPTSRGKGVSEIVTAIGNNYAGYFFGGPQQALPVPGGQKYQFVFAKMTGPSSSLSQFSEYGSSQVNEQNGRDAKPLGITSSQIATDKNGNLVYTVGRDEQYQRPQGGSPVRISGNNIMSIPGVSTTMLVGLTPDFKVMTMDIATAKAGAAAPGTTSTGPSASSAPGLTAGTQSASCAQCSVTDGQISCACDVLPKA